MSCAAADLYRNAFFEGLRPDPDLTVSAWSNEHRILSQKGAAEPGPYRWERTPYLKEIGDNLSPASPIQRIVFMKSAQIGASELGFNWIGYVMHCAPGPMMMVQPTTELAEKVSKQRIASMIDETKCLRELIGPEKARTTGQTILMKEFRGGVLSIVGANSPVGLRSMPIRYLFCDEVDAYPADVGDEGDPVSLAEKRTTTFSRRKIFLTSTPTVKDASKIELEFLATDQRRYFLPCPHCGAMQYLKWHQLKWTDDDPRTAKYECEHCKELIEERFKTEMLAKGQWQATAPGDGVSVGYHINALYSPLGWKSWTDIVKEFLKAKADAPALKTWVNTTLGESWEEEYSAKLGADQLLSRVEFYEPGVAPAGVYFATAGVDVQDNRLAISVYGWGDQEESWVISHQEIFGDPSAPAIWKQLDDLLDSPIRHESAQPIKILAAAIDSGGHATHEVYQFTRERKAKNWIAIKGQSQRGKPAIGKPTRVDINFKGQSLKGGGLVYPVGSDTIKSVLYGRLKHNEPGPGFIHFHAGLDQEFFAQLTAEKQITKYRKGFPIREWFKKAGVRNEGLDCFDRETEVLTKDGWKLWSEVVEADQLATVNKETQLIEYQRPILLIAKQYRGKMISFRSNRVDLLVTPNHRMWVNRVRSVAGKKGWSDDCDIVEAKDVKPFMALKVTAKWTGENSPIEVPEFVSAQGILISERKTVDRKDMAALLGWYLSEGCHFKSGPNCKNGRIRRIGISQLKTRGRDQIRNLVSRLPWRFTETKRSFDCAERQLYDYLRPFQNKSYDMIIPQWIRDSNSEVIDSFLNAYIAGDGWIDKHGHRTIATTCRNTANIIQELFLKLGRNAIIKVRRAENFCPSTIRGRSVIAKRDQFHISEIRTKRAYLYGKDRKSCIESVDYDGLVYCATVPNDTLIIRRNGKMAVTGNCAVYSYAAMRLVAARYNPKSFWSQMAKTLLPKDGTSPAVRNPGHDVKGKSTIGRNKGGFVTNY